MIIETGFLSHYKTKRLCELLGEPHAGIYVLRLWTFCQERRSDQVPADPDKLKAICEYRGEPTEIKRALLMAGFLDEPRNGETTLTVHEWQEYNRQLVASWTNGKRGGRPSKCSTKPSDNPAGTQGKPSDNPAGTQGKPSDNPAGTQGKPSDNPAITQQNPRAGVEKSREDSLSESLSSSVSEGEGDRAHSILKGVVELSGLTWRQDLTARKDVLGSFPEYDFEAAAPVIADRAVKMGAIAHAGSWLSKQYLGLAEQYGRKTEKNGGPELFTDIQ